jgi:flagellin
MGLRIATNVPSLVSQRHLEESSRENSKALARLSSGQRIVNAGDDAAGLAIGQNLQAQVRGLQQAQRNANDGISFAQTAEGGLNEVSNILIRLRELGVQAASDTIGDSERQIIDKEFQQMKAEVDRISQVTAYNGRHLLNGDGGELTFQVGANAGDSQVIHFDSGATDAGAGALGISGLDVESRGSAADSLENIDQAINKVNLFRSSMGALQNRLHSASNNLGSAVENLSEAHSRIADTDIAAEASNLAKTSILQSAGVAVLAQANSIPANAIKLL